MILIVSYDLKSRRDRGSLFNTLQSFGPALQFMACCWLISTNKTPMQLGSAIRPHLNPQDSLFVCMLDNPSDAYLPLHACNWVEAQLRSDARAAGA